MKILLIGRRGQIAWELRRTLEYIGKVVAIDRRSSPIAIDLLHPDSIRHAVRQVRPDLIVNAAAYTAVDNAESEPPAVHQVNSIGPGILAEAVGELGGGIVHFSTDYVFSGNGNSPYTEESPAAPTTVYGCSKREGEIAVSQTGVAHLVFRTGWVYGNRGRNFLLTMLRLIGKGEPVDVVDDQIGSPTWSRIIAECTAMAVFSCIQDGKFCPGQRAGLYHMTSSGTTSWHGFAERIRDLGVKHRVFSQPVGPIRPVSSCDYRTIASRPAYSVLCNHKLHSRFGLIMPSWKKTLKLCMADHPGGLS